MFRLFLLITLLVPFPVFAAENDFDKVCSYFEKLDSVLTHKKMTKSQKAKYISALVTKELKVNSSARETWEVVIYAVPEERYEIYKSTAVELLNADWKCDAMKKHIAMAGE